MFSACIAEILDLFLVCVSEICLRILIFFFTVSEDCMYKLCHKLAELLFEKSVIVPLVYDDEG
jgi:hypothetical protein